MGGPLLSRIRAGAALGWTWVLGEEQRAFPGGSGSYGLPPPAGGELPGLHLAVPAPAPLG